MPPEAKAVEPLILGARCPGGALTANTQMMRDNNIMDKYPEVISAMGEVVSRWWVWDLGHACKSVLLPASLQQRYVWQVGEVRRRVW